MSQICVDMLSPQLRVWVNKVGLQPALALVKTRGGTPFKFPAKAEGSLLEDIVGTDAARILVDLHACQTLNIPKADQILRQIRDQQIFEQRKTMSRTQVALKHNLTTRQVDNICARLADPEPDLQGALFQ